MRLLFGVCFSLISLLSFGKTVSISGNALFFANETIILYQLKSAISMEKMELTRTTISENGDFSLSVPLEKPSHLVVRIEMRELVLHVHPESDIIIDFLPIENVENQRVPLKYQIHYTQISENIAPETQYSVFTSEFADLVSTGNISTNFQELYNPFFNQKDSVYQRYLKNDTLFNQFYTYFKANAYLTTDISKNQLAKRYLNQNHTIDYYGLQYQKFTQAILTPRIAHLFTTQKSDFENAKKEYKIYESLVDFIITDSIFSSRELASLGLLQLIRSSVSENLFSSDEKTAILGQIANFSLYVKQQEAARYFQIENKRLQKNSEAPTFSLENSSGEVIELTSFRDNYVYLGFIHSKSRTCLQDLQVIDNLSKKYRKLQFVLILTDRDSITLSHLTTAGENVHFLYLNKNYSVTEKYEIWSVPVYFLLDKHGYLIQSPSYRPGEMFSIFEQLFDRKRKGKGYEIILD